MDLLIISPEKELLNVKDIDLVECDGIEGKFQILNNHADMFSLLRQGEVIYETALMSRKTMLHILNNILSDFDSDFFDVKIIAVIIIIVTYFLS